MIYCEYIITLIVLQQINNAKVRPLTWQTKYIYIYIYIPNGQLLNIEYFFILSYNVKFLIKPKNLMNTIYF